MDKPNPIPYSFFTMSDNLQIVMSLMLLFVFFILKKIIILILKNASEFFSSPWGIKSVKYFPGDQYGV